MAGTGVVLKIDVEFPETELRQEFVEALKNTEPQITSAMESVAAVAKSALRAHIQSDVYDKWNPTEYVRTGAIINMGESVRETVSSSEMTLRYLPDGSSEQWQNPVGGDALVERIESGTGYEWRKHPGPRPFWKSFVDEMIGGAFASEFDAAMYMQFGADYEGGTVVARESGDGEY
ncbi:MAG: hypothetical protein II346_09775 [Ruminococcus sp.]|nr:hypothetical protein [Ruminococcus sp.]